MAFPYFRHQLHLHRHKITLALVLLLAGLTQTAWAQSNIRVENLPGYEHKKLRWGFSLGVNSSWYQLEHSQQYIDNMPADGQSKGDYHINDKAGIGFNVNFITSYRFSQNFQVRAQPGVGYHSRVIEFAGTNAEAVGSGGSSIQEMNTFAAELPLLAKYESKRRKNTQLYFIGGLKPSLVVGGQKRGNPEFLQVRNLDFAIEYGVGLDMFYPFFKFSPEIRFSRGITNIHEPFPSGYNNSIQQLNTNTVTLYLNFE